MRAIRLTAAGGPEALALEELPAPEPGEADALVRVHAAAITRDELKWFVDRLPLTPSYEVSGVVEPGGEAVYALTAFDRDGAAADYVAVPRALLAPKPAALDDVAAAAVPMGGLSAWQGLIDHGGLASGQRVLIHGAAGGVGHLAVQIAKARGAYVIAPVAAAHVERVRALGADEVFDRDATDFAGAVADVDLVFDTAGGDRLARSPAVLREGGRIVTIAEENEEAGAVYFIVEPNGAQLAELTKLVDAGALTPDVGAVFPLADARAAFERLETPGAGKVVLDVAGA
jgi:NADPH:quinone reductase-like Zn-dependent oxidoreductase